MTTNGKEVLNCFYQKKLRLSVSTFESLHYIHTYIIGHYNPSVRIIDLVSHTTYVVCVNFIHKWCDLQFKVESERQIFFEKLFHGSFLFTLRVFARNLLRGNCRRNAFHICFDAWREAWTLGFRLIPVNILSTRPRRFSVSKLFDIHSYVDKIALYTIKVFGVVDNEVLDLL